MGRPAWVNEQGLMTSTDLDFELVRRTARLDRQLHSTCSEGDSFVVTTMSFTEFELGGCYQDTGEEFNGGVVYATEGSNADQNRLVIPQLFNGTETGENQVSRLLEREASSYSYSQRTQDRQHDTHGTTAPCSQGD